MPNYTPGPWATEQTTLSICRLIVSIEDVSAIAVHPQQDTDYVIAYVPNEYEVATQTANAQLIAAVPEMYEALSATICHACNNRIGFNGAVGYKDCPACREARSALAKAEGRNVR